MSLHVDENKEHSTQSLRLDFQLNEEKYRESSNPQNDGIGQDANTICDDNRKHKTD